ncbi:MAG: endonuclease V [Phycisphaera sp.]|nr:endonuclease V [Phycisphaera sp.]
MIACFDVQYDDHGATAACVGIERWDDAAACERRVVRVADVEAYVPGAFYRRELPCIEAVMRELSGRVDVAVIDGYVWLDDAGRHGLGAHLYDALRQSTPVVGVAKTAFRGVETMSIARPVLRAGSAQPLYVTAAGVDVDDAARHIESMHGEHRIPTILKQVDRLARGLDHA